MNRNPFGLTVVYAGAKGLPAHLFTDCPHVQRKVENTPSGKIAAYRLAENADVLSLCRCHWCRAHYLECLVIASHGPGPH